MRRFLFGASTARLSWGAAIAFFLLIPLAIAGAGVAAWAWLMNEADRAGPSVEPTVVELPMGSGLISIANRLENAGLVRDALHFRLVVTLEGASRDLRAGEYEIPAGASMNEIADQLRQGDVIEYAVTIREGLTSAMIVRQLNETPFLSGEIEDIPAEGTLLPETYSVQRNADRQGLLDRMAEAQSALLDQVWPDRAEGLPIQTQEEAVILASIVEREAGGSEHDLVAGVMVNRLLCPGGNGVCLGRGWRLQVDAAVHYGVNGGEPLFNAQGQRRTLYVSELRNADNPYNTYEHDGLPPGPIANPGRAALEAALNPAQTEAMYFVADGTGGHAFARTASEHNQNVDRWRQIEQERIAAERADR